MIDRRLPLVLVLALAACSRGDRASVQVPGHEGRSKSPASVRAQRRLYDGAPPVIPHLPFGAACTSCHGTGGVEVPGVGYSPPSPHAETTGLGPLARCEQCHVFRRTQEELVANAFAGLRQDLRPGDRSHALAPPTLPHAVFLRENCRACHTGPAAREEIRCTHPERIRCLQCHVPVTSAGSFERGP